MIDFRFIAKWFVAFLSVFVLLTAVLFSQPVKADLNWVCKNGGSTLDKFVQSVEKDPRRSWYKIVGDGAHQTIFFFFEGQSNAVVFVLINQCVATWKVVATSSVISIFDIDLSKLFPPKKGEAL